MKIETSSKTLEFARTKTSRRQLLYNNNLFLDMVKGTLAVTPGDQSDILKQQLNTILIEVDD